MKDNNIAEKLLNRELLPFSHIYWKKKAAKTDDPNIKKSERHKTTREIASIFYKKIIRLK